MLVEYLPTGECEKLGAVGDDYRNCLHYRVDFAVDSTLVEDFFNTKEGM